VVFQQWLGPNGVLAKLEAIFKDAGSSLNSRSPPPSSGSRGSIAGHFALCLVDSLGRRRAG
jgi:hypothetical protein